MRDDRTHPLLAQVPLTVSPFVSLPTAATLPYTYKTMPSTLPPPISGVTGANNSAQKPRYVVAPSGHAAHPTDIVASCEALRAHIATTQTESERVLRELEERIRARELAEKRRVAPGWLDSEARLLQPERSPGLGGDGRGEMGEGEAEVAGLVAEMSMNDGAGAGISEMAAQGEELDRAFDRFR
ncbi:uncharacterized protein GGS22DRAFT_173293 [Annulohypoxylon maeteangense]|uniref:uncharacterized protein n=1 Tax=Annulohypoxylon maeteangense TaxID=1927788 RepID=UPI002008533D|nr:uncharacterized protein GGS22DRAFT_173293 [Annulohypoxylon maeteangense]KAI0881084.1 hypothetical protein GGS22DRAFT_173293 [Annulohypoxylon maeteangense]